MGKRFNLSQLKHAVEQIFRTQDIEAAPHFVNGVSSGNKPLLKSADVYDSIDLNKDTAPIVVSQDRPCFVYQDVTVYADGANGNRGKMNLTVEDDSGTDYGRSQIEVDPSWTGGNHYIKGSMTVYVPPGKEVGLFNTDDPTGNNSGTRSFAVIL